MPCGCPTLLGEKQEGEQEKGEEGDKGSPWYSDGLQMFVISLGYTRCQVDRCCWKNLYYSEERLTFQEWKKGREAARPFSEEMTLNWTADYS